MYGCFKASCDATAIVNSYDTNLARALRLLVCCVLQAPLLQHEYRARGLSRPRSLLTIHNIAFQVCCMLFW
jgi:hypothetical protein